MCRCTSKFVLTILSILFWVAAIGFFAIGTWVFIEYRPYENIAMSLYLLVPASILLIIGIFMFLLGIIGCVGALKEQRCLLGLFFTMLLIIGVGMVVCCVLAYVYRGRIDTGLHDAMKSSIEQYGVKNDTVLDEEIDAMQNKLKCCGVDNYTDWKDTPWYSQQKGDKKPYPTSCCQEHSCNYTIIMTGDKSMDGKQYGPYTEGCYTFLKTEFVTHLQIVGIIAGVLAGILIIGMIFSCVLISRRRREEIPYQGLNDPNGMRV